MKRQDDGRDVTVGCIGFLVLIVAGIIFGGYVLSVLWGWFIVPVFEGAPRLGVMQAYGVMLVVSLLTANRAPEVEDRSGQSIYQRLAIAAGKTFGVPALFLFIGWIAQMFV